MSSGENLFFAEDSVCQYRVTEGLKFIYDIGDTVVYGVEVCKTGCENSLLNCEKCIIPDISSEKNFVLRLIKNMAANSLLPIHAYDVVEDALLA